MILLSKKLAGGVSRSRISSKLLLPVYTYFDEFRESESALRDLKSVAIGSFNSDPDIHEQGSL